MTVASDLMHTPISVTSSNNISETITKMLQMKISRVLVENNGKISHIVTERDIVHFLLDSKNQENLDEILLGTIMKKLVLVDGSKSIKDCANLMLDKKISSLAIGTKDMISGIFTKTDLVKYYASAFSGKKNVSDYMTTSFASMSTTDPLYLVVSKMLDLNISRIVLISPSHKPSGIFALSDLLRISRDMGGRTEVMDNASGFDVFTMRKGFLSKSGFGGVTTAEQIMQNKIISINQDEDLAKACEMMIKNKINGLGVLSNKGDLQGILSKTDVTLAIATMK